LQNPCSRVGSPVPGNDHRRRQRAPRLRDRQRVTPEVGGFESRRSRLSKLLQISASRCPNGREMTLSGIEGLLPGFPLAYVVDDPTTSSGRRSPLAQGIVTREQRAAQPARIVSGRPIPSSRAGTVYSRRSADTSMREASAKSTSINVSSARIRTCSLVGLRSIQPSPLFPTIRPAEREDRRGDRRTCKGAREAGIGDQEVEPVRGGARAIWTSRCSDASSIHA
jgi:hypothetical protein